MHKSVGFVVAVYLVIASIRPSASATEKMIQPIPGIGPAGPIVRKHTGFNWTGAVSSVARFCGSWRGDEAVASELSAVGRQNG